MTINFDKEPANSVNWLRDSPISHRALHDKSRQVYENTLSAAQASVEAGYPIEVDLQISSDTVPMVFHDYQLERMTGVHAGIRQTESSELQSMKIGNSDDCIPTLAQLLDLVGGKVGLVLELKGLPGKDDGFIRAVTDLLDTYAGDAVIMSFHHHLLRDARRLAPHLPLGLTAEGDDRFYDDHKSISLECNVDFVSYHVEGLETQFAMEFRETGRPLISWTIRDREQYAYSLKYSDQPTFEGFVI